MPFVFLLKQLCFIEDVAGTSANPVVLSQVDPAHAATRVDQKLSRTRNIPAVSTRMRVHQIITANHFRGTVGKKRKRITRLLDQVARLFRSVRTNRDRPDSRLIKTRQIIFNTP